MKKLFLFILTIISITSYAQDVQVTLTNLYSVDYPHVAIGGSNTHLVYGTNFSYYKFDVNGPAAPIDTPITPTKVYGPNTTDIAVNYTDTNNVAIIYYDYNYDHATSLGYYGCFVVQSNDGGTTWGNTIFLDTVQLGSSIGNLVFNMPKVEFSQNGNMYMMWEVHSNGTDTNAIYFQKNLEPKKRIDNISTNDFETAVGLTIESHDDTDWIAISYGKVENYHVKFYLTYSKDAASTFSAPVLVKDDGETFLTTEHQTKPFLNDDGKILVVYKDFSHGPKLTTSDDNGTTWSHIGTVETHKYVYVAIERVSKNYYVKLLKDDSDNMSFWISSNLLDWQAGGKINSNNAQVTSPGSFVDLVLDKDGEYFVTAWVDNRTGNEEIFYSKTMLPELVGINDKIQLPKEFSLNQNYPNPFNPTTTISYKLPSDSHVKIEIFNSLGESVDVLVNNIEQAGIHSVVWNASLVNKQIASGAYIVRLTAVLLNDSKTFTNTRKMLLLK